MPKPIKRAERSDGFAASAGTALTRKANTLSWIKQSVRLTIPNPHRGAVDWLLTSRILKEAGITPDEWEKV